jgi:hypothetical protein
MPFSKIVAANLRRAQAFNQKLRTQSEVDKAADQYADTILFERNASRRQTKIAKLVDKVSAAAKSTVMPQAHKIGTDNALDLIKATPAPPFDITNEQARKTAIFNGRIRFKRRLEIIRQSVAAQGAKLDARLARYWLEPAEGSAKDKVQRLRTIHKQLEQRRKQWEKDMRDFDAGILKKRPKQPDLDFLSEFVAEAKKEIRTQARRTGTDAEISLFQARGHKYFVWITPNGHNACPDCQKRQNVKLTIELWEQLGRPGSGLTICKENCYCMLIPEEAISKAPYLLTKLVIGGSGVLTTPEQMAIFNRHRIRP